nr:rRNA maturation RNase YbeY [Anaerolineae bacterium]
MSGDHYAVYVSVDDPYVVNQAGLQAAGWHTLNMVQVEAGALTISIASSERVRKLNRQYAGNDYETDVLSFAAEDEPYAIEPDEPPYLGDVIVAYEVADRQARQAGHTLLAELQTLAVHGTLHLLGFDHQTPDQQAEMWAYQSAIMDVVRAGGYT